MSDDHGKADAKFLIGLFLGGIIGALVIFFLGTKEGKKAGKLIEEKGKDALDDLKNKVQEIEKRGKEVKEEIIEVIEEKKEELTEATTEKLESALTKIEELQAQSMTTTAEIRKKFFKNIPKKR